MNVSARYPMLMVDKRRIRPYIAVAIKNVTASEPFSGTFPENCYAWRILLNPWPNSAVMVVSSLGKSEENWLFYVSG